MFPSPTSAFTDTCQNFVLNNESSILIYLITLWLHINKFILFIWKNNKNVNYFATKLKCGTGLMLRMASSFIKKLIIRSKILFNFLFVVIDVSNTNICFYIMNFSDVLFHTNLKPSSEQKLSKICYPSAGYNFFKRL